MSMPETAVKQKLDTDVQPSSLHNNRPHLQISAVQPLPHSVTAPKVVSLQDSFTSLSQDFRPRCLGVRHDDDDHSAESTPVSGFSELDSLFDELLPSAKRHERPLIPPTPALLSAPPIRGLFFTPSLQIPRDLASVVVQYCFDTYFKERGEDGINQAMLFGRSTDSVNSVGSSMPPSTTSPNTGLPPILDHLLIELKSLLHPCLPSSTYDLLFPTKNQPARQAILNLYRPGEGISRHVDLLNRFGDGIIGVSLGSGCVMQFARADQDGLESTLTAENLGVCSGLNFSSDDSGSAVDAWDLYLPERSVLVLSGDARYCWTHGIDSRKSDYVSVAAMRDDQFTAHPGKWVDRGLRLSITFRWLLPGANVLGG